MPQIKRYPNRKLYDTEAKRYVTLEEITEMIRADQDVHVTDHETGDDLTTLTLTQIILEQEKKASGFLPRSLLTSLIRTGGDTLEQVIRSLQATLPVSGHGHTHEAEDETANEAATATGGDAEADDKAAPGSAVDDRVSDMFHLLNVPTRRDVRRLQEQLDLLNAKLEELSTAADTVDGEKRASEEANREFADRS